MGEYVIWNLTQRKYVSMPGQASSYTSKLQDARRFNGREAAQKECCGNEVVIPR